MGKKGRKFPVFCPFPASRPKKRHFLACPNSVLESSCPAHPRLCDPEQGFSRAQRTHIATSLCVETSDNSRTPRTIWCACENPEKDCRLTVEHESWILVCGESEFLTTVFAARSYLERLTRTIRPIPAEASSSGRRLACRIVGMALSDGSGPLQRTKKGPAEAGPETNWMLRLNVSRWQRR